MSIRKEIVKPFEFSLRINGNIICQRFFIVKNYNNDCRESLGIREMMDEIMGTNQHMELGLIPEYFKFKCINNSYKYYYSENSRLSNKDAIFTFEVSKNNVNKLRDKNGDFDVADLQKEVIATGMFDGKLFHPNVRCEIDIRSIIPDIVKTIQGYFSAKSNTRVYGSTQLVRKNKLTYGDIAKIESY